MDSRRIAIIGAGISGLAAAYYLSRRYRVAVFEKQNRIGGHTNTVDVPTPNGTLAVDTGFIVHNEKTYPNFCRLMAELGVATKPSDMSFGVHDPKTGFAYSSRGAAGFFANPQNAISPRHWKLLQEIKRFNRDAKTQAEDLTLREFLDRYGYSADFRSRYLYPMTSAVWSTSPENTDLFPASTLIRFFDNHGLLAIDNHPQWRVLGGGSNSYLEPLTARFRDSITTGAQIASVTRDEAGVRLRFDDRPEETFDDVVFACHGDEILPLLADATPREREILGNFTTTRNETVLHTDSRMLPKQLPARASWNYRLGDEGRVTVTYYMNRLQGLSTVKDYCVTLNCSDEIDPTQVIRTFLYEHPLYTREAIRAQERWAEISGVRRTHFCGAYWFYGFHEDGLNSALRVARALGVDA